MRPRLFARYATLAALAGAAALFAGWLDARYGWITPAFDAIAHQFYEVPLLARIRRPSQLVLVRWHLALGSAMLVLGLLFAPLLSRHGRAWCVIFATGYALRAVIWICGSNLPLVPGDSCHYIEVATSVLQGEGPVKHYVESFFRDYPRIRQGQGVLDDWSTPLDAYVRAMAWRLAGLGPASPLGVRFAVAKACSFILNLLAMPALYVFAWRRYGPSVALWAMAALAVLPVHAIYAGFVLRESLVALLSILAVWTFTEVWHTPAVKENPKVGDPQHAWTSTEHWHTPAARSWSWIWAVAAGLFAGLAVLARTTMLALVVAAGLFALVAHGRRQLGQLLVWTATLAVVILPWAWETMQEYQTPFYSYTNYFEYNFSWTVHHFDRGNTLPGQFYTLANLPEIVRVKVKSLLIIAVYSTMIVGLPMVMGFIKRLNSRGGWAGRTELLIGMIFVVFVLATLKSIADVTQVAQLGRYYLPVFVLALPAAVAGVLDWLESLQVQRRVLPLLAATYCALLWADPTWAYDASWLVKRYQLHWPALREAGDWIGAHPQLVSSQARIMTWFPWELRVVSQRTTILMPRNYSLRRIQEVIRQYGVTHILWGSFEPPPYHEINPESWALALEQLRTALGLTEKREMYRSSGETFFPVRLYRLQ